MLFSKENIIGAKFNKWTVIGEDNGTYQCQCKCSNIKTMTLYKINNQPTYSCNKCAKRRMFAGFSKMKNIQFVIPNGGLNDLG